MITKLEVNLGFGEHYFIHSGRYFKFIDTKTNYFFDRLYIYRQIMPNVERNISITIEITG